MYMEAISSNSTRKLLWFEITKTLTALNKFVLLFFFIIFGTFSFLISQEVAPVKIQPREIGDRSILAC